MSAATSISSHRPTGISHRFIVSHTAARRVGIIVGALGLLVASAATSAAQSASPTPRRWEFLIAGGAFVPAGEQRDFLNDAHVSAAQLSWRVRPSLAVTGTFGWARS